MQLEVMVGELGSQRIRIEDLVVKEKAHARQNYFQVAHHVIDCFNRLTIVSIFCCIFAR